MELELDPQQPDEVVRAVEAALREARAAHDPWWDAGIAENLGE